MAIDVRAAVAEFLAMLLFVFFTTGCATAGTAGGGANNTLAIALQFGFLITVLAYAIGQYSGGQINCAVTFGLVLAGKLDPAQAGVNFVAQMVGSCCAALLVCAMIKEESMAPGVIIGTNAVNDAPNSAGDDTYSAGQALLGEIMGTFLLMYTVLETAVNPNNNSNAGITAPIAIGLSVFLAHVLLIPIDGCSINPTRTFGPILIATITDRGEDLFDDHWVFWVGPLVGAGLAVGVYKLMSEILAPKAADEAPAEAAAEKA